MRGTPEERFWAKVHEGPRDTCWLWMGGTIKHGYGTFRGGKHVLAHRFAYELLRGPIPEGLVLDHLCRVPRCVNPWHLEAITYAENTQRGRPWQRYKGSCGHGHEFTDANTYVYANGKRRCKTCARRWSRETRERMKTGTTFKGQGRPPTRA